MKNTVIIRLYRIEPLILQLSILICSYITYYDFSRLIIFLLTQMQDEVHRFAISYHRRVRNKAMTKSILDEVEGIGEVRKKEIWKHFKSLKRLKEASVEEIAQVIPEKTAITLYNVLHNTDQNGNEA